MLPVIEAVLRERPGTIISIDTYKAETARAAVTAGAEIVNDISGFLWDGSMAAACAELGCGTILMHTRGKMHEWRTQPPLPHDEVVPLVLRELGERVVHALTAGIRPERMVLDPGFGSGETRNEEITHWPISTRCMPWDFRSSLALHGNQLALGHTLSSIYKNVVPPDERDVASAASITAAVLAGAHLVRVHDVRTAREAVAVADAIRAHSLNLNSKS